MKNLHFKLGIVLFVFTILTSIQSNAQEIVNGGFEEWDTDTILIKPLGWQWLISPGDENEEPPPFVRTTEAFIDSFALQIASTVQSEEGPYPAYCIQSIDFEQPISSATLNFNYAVDQISEIEGYVEIKLTAFYVDMNAGTAYKIVTFQDSLVNSEYSTGSLTVDTDDVLFDGLTITLTASNYVTGWFSQGLTIGRFDNLHLSTIVSVEERDLPKLNLTILPNPVTDQLFLKTDASFQKIELIDITGKSVEILNVDQRQFDFSALHTGLYILKLTTEDGVYNRKVIKK